MSPFCDRIATAFVSGSIAKTQDTASRDIEVMIISDTLSCSDLFPALQRVQDQLRRTINPTILSRKDLKRRAKHDDPFVARVLSQPKILLFGTEDGFLAV